jgi:predicted dehydrogenase
VLCEKPIGLTEAEAIQIEKAVTHAHVCFEAGYSFRYLPAWQHGAQLAAFAATIREKREPPITVGDGRKVLKVFDAILRSGETGKPVQLT